jgi:hypothetical protein
MIFGSCPTPPPSTDSKVDWRYTGRLKKRNNLLAEKGVGGGGGAKSFDGEKAWFSKIIQYSLALNNNLKVHKNENFFYSDFGICVISLLGMSKY